MAIDPDVREMIDLHAQELEYQYTLLAESQKLARLLSTTLMLATFHMPDELARPIRDMLRDAYPVPAEHPASKEMPLGLAN